MDVVILAGGLGTRMRPLTYTRPKPLLPLLNRPLLAHILERLPRDTGRIVLPVNYLREQIEAYFEDHPDPRVVLVDEAEPLGTGGAIKNCERHLSGTFLVYNGDIVTNLDLAAMRARHRDRRAEVTLSLWPVDEPWHFGVARLGAGDRIEAFVEKPPQGQEPSRLINAGHYLLEPSVLDAIPGGRFFSIERELYEPWARAGRRLFGFPFQGYWIDCGRPEMLLAAHATVLAEQGRSSEVAAEADVATTGRVAGYAVAEGCRVGPRAVVERSVLLPGVRLGRDVVVRDSLLGEGVELEDGVHLERVVVGDYGVVESGRRIHDQRIGMRPVDVEA